MENSYVKLIMKSASNGSYLTIVDFILNRYCMHIHVASELPYQLEVFTAYIFSEVATYVHTSER